MKFVQPEYAFKADINHYVSATCLEELTSYLLEVGQAISYKGAMKELKNLHEAVQWWIDNLEDDDNDPSERCYKDGRAYADMVGE